MNPTPAPVTLFCSQCGQPKPEQELAHFGNVLVCAACKPAYAQRLTEGAVAPSTFHYGGFWIRAVAYLIDSLILGFASAVVQSLLLPTLGLRGSVGATGAAVAMLGLAYLIAIAMGATYEGLFVYKLGATPGKLVLRARVVDARSGGPLSVRQAWIRVLACPLSYLTGGHLLAIFDARKQALHDKIAGTVVIRPARSTSENG